MLCVKVKVRLSCAVVYVFCSAFVVVCIVFGCKVGRVGMDSPGSDTDTCFRLKSFGQPLCFMVHNVSYYVQLTGCQNIN